MMQRRPFFPVPPNVAKKSENAPGHRHEVKPQAAARIPAITNRVAPEFDHPADEDERTPFLGCVYLFHKGGFEPGLERCLARSPAALRVAEEYPGQHFAVQGAHYFVVLAVDEKKQTVLLTSITSKAIHTRTSAYDGVKLASLKIDPDHIARPHAIVPKRNARPCFVPLSVDEYDCAQLFLISIADLRQMPHPPLDRCAISRQECNRILRELKKPIAALSRGMHAQT